MSEQDQLDELDREIAAMKPRAPRQGSGNGVGNGVGRPSYAEVLERPTPSIPEGEQIKLQGGGLPFMLDFQARVPEVDPLAGVGGQVDALPRALAGGHVSGGEAPPGMGGRELGMLQASPGQTLGALGMDPLDAEIALMGSDGFVEGFAGAFGKGKSVPFVGAALEAVELSRLYDAAQRFEAGEQTEEDLERLRGFIIHASRKKRFGYSAGAILAELPAMMGEFGVAGKMATAAGKKVAGTAIGAAIQSAIAKRAAAGVVEAAGSALARGTAAAVGTGLMFAANPLNAGRTAAEAYRRALPEMQLGLDEAGELALLFTTTSGDFVEQLPKGFLDTVIEGTSESAGGLVEGAGAAVLKGLQATALRRWLGEGTGRTVGGFADRVRRYGWNGVIGEWFEERVGDVAREVTGLNEAETVFPGWEQQAEEFVAFMMGGTAIAGAQRVLDPPLAEPRPNILPGDPLYRGPELTTVHGGGTDVPHGTQQDVLDLPPSGAETGAADVPPVSRGVREGSQEGLGEAGPAETARPGDGERVSPTGEAEAPGDVPALPSGQLRGDAPPGLQQAPGGRGGLQEVPPETAPAGNQPVKPETARAIGAYQRAVDQDVYETAAPPEEAENNALLEADRGVAVVYIRSEDGSPLPKPAAYIPGTGTILIDANAGTAAQRRGRVLHEIVHDIAGASPELFEHFDTLLARADPGYRRASRLQYLKARRAAKKLDPGAPANQNLTREQRIEEGAAVAAERVAGYFDWLARNPEEGARVLERLGKAEGAEDGLLRRLVRALADLLSGIPGVRSFTLRGQLRALETRLAEQGFEAVEGRVGLPVAAALREVIQRSRGIYAPRKVRDEATGPLRVRDIVEARKQQLLEMTTEERAEEARKEVELAREAVEEVGAPSEAVADEVLGEEEGTQFAEGWHGTPHDFDEFSTEKIGTGEGAQAYGWGLYFASRRGVGEHYRKQLGGNRFVVTYDGYLFDRNNLPAWTDAGRPAEQFYALESLAREGSFDEAAAQLRQAPEYEGLESAADWLLANREAISVRPRGRLYKVDLVPAEEDYLLHDEALDAQPATVMRALGLREPTDPEGVPHSVATAANHLRDIAVSEPFRSKGLGMFKVPTQRAVLKHVVTAAQDPQVFDAIVQAIPVDMMDILVAAETTPEVALHDESVLHDAFTTGPNHSVSVGRDGPASELVRVAARAGAEYLERARPTRAALEGRTAAVADVRAHVQRTVSRVGQKATGKQLYDALSDSFDAPVNRGAKQKLASLALLDAGIRGIKYLDGSSRGKGEGSYNYVLFDAGDVSVEAKFAEPRPQVDLPSPRWYGAAQRRIYDEWTALLELERHVAAREGVERLPEEERAFAAYEVYKGKAFDRITEQVNRRFMKPVAEILRETKISIERAGEFLYAQHAPEANAQLKKVAPDNPSGSGMSDVEAAEVMESFSEEEIAALRRVSDLVQQLHREKQDRLVEAGLVTQEEVDAWNATYTYYVPLKGFAEGEVDNESPASYRARTGRGIDIRGKESKRRTGRTTRAANPLLTSLADAHGAVVRAERAVVGQRFLALVEKHPEIAKVDEPEMMPIIEPRTGLRRMVVDPSWMNDDLTVGVKRDGVQHLIRIPEELRDIANAMRSNNTRHLQALFGSAWYRWPKKGGQFFSGATTRWNPGFLPFNLMRDVGAGTGLTWGNHGARRAAEVFFGVPRSWRVMAKAEMGKARALFPPGWGPVSDEAMAEYERYKRSGAPISVLGLNSLEAVQERLEGEIKRAARAGPVGSSLRVLDAIGGWITAANDIVEQGTRFSAWRSARKAGWTEEDAAREAKSLTGNFEKSGSWTPITNTLYVFSRAAIVSTGILAKGIRDSKRLRALLAGQVVASAALSAINRMVAPDDETGENMWESLPRYQKHNYIVFMKPDGGQIQIPAPFGFNIFHALGVELEQAFAGDQPIMSSVQAMMGALIDGLDPFTGGSDQSITIRGMPTLIRPAFELAQNEDFTGRPIRPSYPSQGPMSEHHTEGASEFSRSAATAWNELFGGSKWESGKLGEWDMSVSPDDIDHILGFIGGGVGRFVLRGVETTQQATDEADSVQIRNVPILRRMYRSPRNPYKARGNFIDYHKRIRAKRKEIRERREEGDHAGADTVQREHAQLLSLYQMFQASDRRARKLNEQLQGKAGDERRLMEDELSSIYAEAVRMARRAEEE